MYIVRCWVLLCMALTVVVGADVVLPTTPVGLVGWRVSSNLIPRGMVIDYPDWLAAERGDSDWVVDVCWPAKGETVIRRISTNLEETASFDCAALALIASLPGRSSTPKGKRIPSGGCSPDPEPNPCWLESPLPERRVIMFTGNDLVRVPPVGKLYSQIAYALDPANDFARPIVERPCDEKSWATGAGWAPGDTPPMAVLLDALYRSVHGFEEPPADIPFEAFQSRCDERTNELMDLLRVQQPDQADFPQRIVALFAKAYGDHSDPDFAHNYGNRFWELLSERTDEGSPWAWELLLWLEQHEPSNRELAYHFSWLPGLALRYRTTHPDEVANLILARTNHQDIGHRSSAFMALIRLDSAMGLAQLEKASATDREKMEAGYPGLFVVLGSESPEPAIRRSLAVRNAMTANDPNYVIEQFFSNLGFLPTPEFAHAGLPGFHGCVGAGWVDGLLALAEANLIELVDSAIIDDPRLRAKREERRQQSLPVNLFFLPRDWLTIYHRLESEPRK